MIAAQQLDGGHDSQGNPQRLWIVYRTLSHRHALAGRAGPIPESLDTIILDEGYSGRRILLVDMTMDEYKGFTELESIRISAAEYKRLRKRRLE